MVVGRHVRFRGAAAAAAAAAGRRIAAVLLGRERGLQGPLRVHGTVQAQGMVARQQHGIVEQLLASGTMQFVLHRGGLPCVYMRCRRRLGNVSEHKRRGKRELTRDGKTRIRCDHVRGEKRRRTLGIQITEGVGIKYFERNAVKKKK